MDYFDILIDKISFTIFLEIFKLKFWDFVEKWSRLYSEQTQENIG